MSCLSMSKIIWFIGIFESAHQNKAQLALSIAGFGIKLAVFRQCLLFYAVISSWMMIFLLIIKQKKYHYYKLSVSDPN